MSLYKFASVVSAGAPVVMKYGLFSWVLLFNMQGTLCTDRSDSAHCVFVIVNNERVRDSDGLTPCV